MENLSHPNAATTSLAVVTLPAGTATQLAVANGRRRLLAIANSGSNIAHMSFANTVTAGQGWPLPSSGGYEWPATAVHVDAVWAISALGTTVIVMQG